MDEDREPLRGFLHVLRWLMEITDLEEDRRCRLLLHFEYGNDIATAIPQLARAIDPEQLTAQHLNVMRMWDLLPWGQDLLRLIVVGDGTLEARPRMRCFREASRSVLPVTQEAIAAHLQDARAIATYRKEIERDRTRDRKRAQREHERWLREQRRPRQQDGQEQEQEQEQPRYQEQVDQQPLSQPWQEEGAATDSQAMDTNEDLPDEDGCGGDGHQLEQEPPAFLANEAMVQGFHEPPAFMPVVLERPPPPPPSPPPPPPVVVDPNEFERNVQLQKECLGD